MPIPEEHNFAADAANIERTLSVRHQQFNTEFMYRLDRITIRHEHELIGLAVVILVLAISLAFDDYRIRRIDATLDNQESLNNRKAGYRSIN